MQIRGMNLWDYQAVDRLMQQLHKLHVGERPDFFLAQEHPYTKEEYAQMIEDKNIITILAEESGSVVGICIVTIKDKSGMVEMQTAHMNALIVDEQFRNRGYAKQLFQAVQSQAKEKGAQRLELMVWSFNEPALKLYQSLGMTPQRYVYEKIL